jgi:S1-C subfamily serine protease
MRRSIQFVILSLVTLASAFPAASDIPAFSAAVCPVVYQLDDSPGARGYHYVFYGNSFFINRDGYLLTAAHVLSQFRDGGGQPCILVRLAMAPPRLLKVQIVATDVQHDVAILRVTPNPFAGPYTVAVLPLAGERAAIGESVVANALRPARLRDPHTFEVPIEDLATGEILSYLSVRLDSAPGESVVFSKTNSGTDIFLFSHEVLRGQSGAPVLSAESHEVVGIVEGRWLHPAGPLATQGAAIPVTYALALLREHHIAWDTIAASASQKN